MHLGQPESEAICAVFSRAALRCRPYHNIFTALCFCRVPNEVRKELNEIANIISRLEDQKAAIDRALQTLQDFAATGSITPPQSGRKRTPARKGGMTPEGRRRLALAMKRRWAAKRTGAQANEAKAKKATTKKATAKKATAKKATAKKAGLSAAGRKKLAEAMKRRWAAKRTAAQAKKKAA